VEYEEKSKEPTNIKHDMMTSGCMDQVIGEVIQFELHPKNINREDDFSLSRSEEKEEHSFQRQNNFLLVVQHPSLVSQKRAIFLPFLSTLALRKVFFHTFPACTDPRKGSSHISLILPSLPFLLAWRGIYLLYTSKGSSV
jgi:hypothetical protein